MEIPTFNLIGIIDEPDPFYELMTGQKEPGIVGISMVKQFLNENQSANELQIVINSPGGNAQMGLDIHDALVNSGKRIICRVEGTCYSAATPALLAAKLENRSMMQNSTVGIHLPYIPPYTLADAYTADELQSLADNMRVFEDLYIKLYSESTGQAENELRDLMKAETLMDGEAAKKYGFVSEVVTTSVMKMVTLKAVAFINSKSKDMDFKEAITKLTSMMGSLGEKFENLVKPKAQDPEPEPEPIVDPAPEETIETVKAENDSLKTKIVALEAELQEAKANSEAVETLKAEFDEMKQTFEGLKTTVSSFKPDQRTQAQIQADKDFKTAKEEGLKKAREFQSKNPLTQPKS